MKYSFLISVLIFSNFLFGQTKPSKYYNELNNIKKDLNEIENVEVLNIWGHEDVTLEEISARLEIKDKGEIVLNGLSKDSFDYPKSIPITEIGGYSFSVFTCSGGVGHSINIGSESEFFSKLNREYHSVKDIVENYDLIFKLVDSLKISPEINHFDTGNSEHYILVEKKKSIDRDPIFNLFGAQKLFEFAEQLKWNNPKCRFYK